MEQRKEIDFEGQNIYIGIDVHLKTWNVTVMTPSGYKKKHTQPSCAQALFEHLSKHYPNGIYQAVYESGFSGFSTYYALEHWGIHCMVIHAADVPSTQYEQVMKSDPIDSEKLVKALKAGSLHGIYIPRKENLDDRAVIRFRKVLQKQLGGYKSRVKHLLYNNGVEFPVCFSSPGSHWSKRFMCWLREEVVLLSPSRNSLDLLLGQVELFRKSLLGTTRRVRALSREERYVVMCNRLMSIPGIGMLTAMCLLVEVDDPSRFNNEKQFASYLGLVPTSHSSGEKKIQGEKTFRGNKHVGTLIIESAWTAIRHDAALAASFGEYSKRMKPQEAIVRIARKLSNRILSTLKSGKQYEYGRCR
jgi:transposase